MATRQFTFTQEEARLISQWANNAWHDLDQHRMLTTPNSPKEAAVLADQVFIEAIRAKLGGRPPQDSVPGMA